MRLTEQELKAILQNKPGFWQEIVTRISREARRQGSRAVTSLGAPDSTIAGESALPINERQESWRERSGEIVQESARRTRKMRARIGDEYTDAVEKPRRPIFDSMYEIKTIQPQPRIKHATPAIRKGDQSQRFAMDSLSLERGATEAAAIRQLLSKWNTGKQAEPEPARKIVIQRKTLEKRR